jgi:hypothetical protein
MNLKYGCDPEVFAVINNDKVVSPALLMEEGLIKPVEQDKKHPVFISTGEFKWHMDGVAFELTACNPIENYLQMHDLVEDALDALENYFYPLKYKGEQVSLYKKPVVSIDPTWYNLNNPLVYQGFIFGCDKDYDALDIKYNCQTMDVFTHPYRYGGGHLHISGEEKLRMVRPAIFCQIITTGCFCVANSLFLKEDKQRVETYGKPGRYRPQKYKDGSIGIEYRSPSNSWLSLGTSRFEELFYWMRKGVEYLINEEYGVDLVNTFLESAVDAINTCNPTLAKNILRAQ